MRGVRAKQLRRYVRETYPYLMPDVHYTAAPSGAVVCTELCMRGQYRWYKKAYKRLAKRGMHSV